LSDPYRSTYTELQGWVINILRQIQLTKYTVKTKKKNIDYMDIDYTLLPLFQPREMDLVFSSGTIGKRVGDVAALTRSSLIC